VLVLDSDNKQVVLLDPDLGHVLDVVHGLSEPRRLYWDDANSRLYIADSTGNIAIYQLLP